MRFSRIMAIMMVLCFMFVGVSSLWAKGKKELVMKDQKIFTVNLDDNGKIINGEYEGDTPGHPVQVLPEDISKLTIKIGGEEGTFDMKSLTPGTVIYTGPGDTCVWYFDGSKYVRRCY